MPSASDLVYLQADFDHLDGVAGLAGNIRSASGGTIDLLINNAGRPGSPTRQVTVDGNEATFQTNYLAPVLLTESLVDLMGATGPARIVNVASATHLSTTLYPDPQLERAYAPTVAYAKSKLAVVTWSCWLSDYRLAPSIEVVSIHPGIVATRLLHAMFDIGGEPPEMAAAHLVAAAFRHGDHGTYYDEAQPSGPNPDARHSGFQAVLWGSTRALLGAHLGGLAARQGARWMSDLQRQIPIRRQREAELNEALALYFGRGITLYPHEDDARVIGRVGHVKAAYLLPVIKALVREFDEFNPDWSKETLDEAADLAVSRVARTHPELNQQGQAVLKNVFHWSYR